MNTQLKEATNPCFYYHRGFYVRPIKGNRFEVQKLGSISEQIIYSEHGDVQDVFDWIDRTVFPGGYKE